MIEPSLEQQRAAEAALYSGEVIMILEDKDETDVADVQTIFFKDEWLSLTQDNPNQGLHVVVLSPAQAYALWFALNARYS